MVSDEYVAGFLDGEGYISMAIRQRRERDRMHEWSTEIVVSVSGTNRAPLDAFAERFGGSVYLTHKNQGTVARDAYRYQATGRIAEAVLRAALPHLLVKHRQAALCLEQRENLLQGGRATPERAAYNARAMQRRRELHQEIRRLNQRGRRQLDLAVDTPVRE